MQTKHWSTEGQHFRIELLLFDDGRCPAEEFLEQLTDKDLEAVVARLEYLAATQPGQHLSPEMFKKVEGSEGIFELKAGRQVRILCFQYRGSWVLTEGFIKQQRRLQRRERGAVRRSEGWRRDFLLERRE